MQSNTCSFTGRLAKKASVGTTNNNVPVCSANIVLSDNAVVAVQAFGGPARALAQATENQLVTVIGIIAFSDGRKRFEVKASTIALIPETNDAEVSQ